MAVAARLCLAGVMSVLAPGAIASTGAADQPVMPRSPVRAVVQQQWSDLRLKALAGDAQAAAKLGESYETGPSRDVAEAMRWLRKASGLGSPDGQRELGLLLLRGDAVSPDPGQAAPLLRQAAESGDVTAEATLGVMYAYGDGVAQDWPLALEWTRRAAEQDDPWAQANLGLYLETGRDGAPRPEEAAAWYRRAAARGFALAQTRLGLWYQRYKSEPERAFGLFLQAAQQRDPVSERILALAYRDGDGVAANQAEAVAWFDRAASHGDADAMYLVSAMYAAGQGVAKSRHRAWNYLVDAATKGHALAAARVGLAFADGGFGQEADAAAALKWLGTAVDQAAREASFDPEEAGTYRERQLAEARYRLGMMLLPTDKDRAAALLRQAAAHGCGGARYELGRMLRAGTGVPRDTAAAVKLFESAASGGVGAAAFELASGYADGSAGPRSVTTALRWYRRAAALGYAPAWLALGRAYEEAGGVALDEAEALTWYQLAGNAGIAQAQLRLGDIARTAALGQPRNEQVALRWYRLAADQGDAAAEERIGDLYWEGSGNLARDRAEAARHYGIAARAGRASAEGKLALAFARGDGVPPDDGMMLFWSRKAAQAGDGVAAAVLGHAIMLGIDGTYDWVEAATWLTVAANSLRDGTLRADAARRSKELVGKLTPAERAAYHARVVRLGAAPDGG
jgi:TPR repeat protein